MSAVEKLKQALVVAEKCGFESIIGIDATRFEFMKAQIHLEHIEELTGYDCQTVEHTDTSRMVFAMIDGVKVFVLINIESCVA